MNKKLGYAYLFLAFGLFLIFLYYLPGINFDLFRPYGKSVIERLDGNHLFWFVESVLYMIALLIKGCLMILSISHLIALFIATVAAIRFARDKFHTADQPEGKAKRDTKPFVEGDRVYTRPVAGVDKHRMYGVILASDYNTTENKKRVQFDGIAKPHQVDVNYLHHAKSED